MSISPAFNVTNLFPSEGIFEPPVLPSYVFASTSSISCAPSTVLEPPDEILDVLNDDFVTSHSGDYHHFLVRWKDLHFTMTLGSMKKNFFILILAFLRVIYALPRQRRVRFTRRGNDGDHN